MKFIIVSFLFIPFFLLAQQHATNSAPIDTVFFSKWNKAIVNLEVRRANTSNIEAINLLSDINDSIARKFVTVDRYSQVLDNLVSAVQQFTGTSIFLKFERKRYLITARHVLFDKQNYIEAYNRGLVNEYTKNPYLSIPFQRIYRIPPDGQKPSPSDPVIVLLETESPYIFSDPSEDLAIISLDENFRDFAGFLETKGHVPITISDIDTLSKVQYGQDITVFGYPFFSLGSIRINSNAESNWRSSFVFENSVSFGRISSISFQKYFFIADANIAPGYGGGAIVSNNKLIGVVATQSSYALEDINGSIYPNLKYQVPFTIGIKASFIPPLLRQLIFKMNNKRQPH